MLCYCVCGCEKPVTRRTVKKSLMYAGWGCKSNKPSLVDSGIIPEYRKSRIKSNTGLKNCLNPECTNRVKTNTAHFCSRKCARDSKEHHLQVEMRKLLPDGYLTNHGKGYIFSRAIAKDRVAIEVLLKMNMYKLYHEGIFLDLTTGKIEKCKVKNIR